MSELEALKELVMEKFRAIAEALGKQALEYERRLSALNHEAAQLKDMQATYMPRELYESEILNIRQELKELNAFKNNLIGKLAVVAILVSMAISIVVGGLFLLINYYVIGV